MRWLLLLLLLQQGLPRMVLLAALAGWVLLEHSLVGWMHLFVVCGMDAGG